VPLSSTLLALDAPSASISHLNVDHSVVQETGATAYVPVVVPSRDLQTSGAEGTKRLLVVGGVEE